MTRTCAIATDGHPRRLAGCSTTTRCRGPCDVPGASLFALGALVPLYQQRCRVRVSQTGCGLAAVDLLSLVAWRMHSAPGPYASFLHVVVLPGLFFLYTYSGLVMQRGWSRSALLENDVMTSAATLGCRPSDVQTKNLTTETRRYGDKETRATRKQTLHVRDIFRSAHRIHTHLAMRYQQNSPYTYSLLITISWSPGPHARTVSRSASVGLRTAPAMPSDPTGT